MMAAISASKKSEVTLYERNDRLGKKLLITGKGRCNVTNSGTLEEIVEAFGKNGRFLFSALHRFSNQDLMSFFEKRGVPLKVERGKRVFPVSDRSLDIVAALEKEMKDCNVQIRLQSRVQTVSLAEDGRFIIKEEGGLCVFDRLIITTGGKSYPATGSTGDGYGFAEGLGHTTTRLRPYLIPLESQEQDVRSMMGLSLKNVNLRILINGKKKGEEFGEMIFTHFGISGPTVLTLSNYVVQALEKKGSNCLCSIDLKPALTQEALDKRIQRDFEKYSNKQFKNSLDELLPQKMIPVVVERSGIDPEKRVNQISRQERVQLVDIIKNFQVKISGVRPLSEAIITAGGISLKEVDPQTMESKLVPGLFFAGEILDLDGVTGGFNLQEAFSTGFLAGESISS